MKKIIVGLLAAGFVGGLMYGPRDYSLSNLISGPHTIEGQGDIIQYGNRNPGVYPFSDKRLTITMIPAPQFVRNGECLEYLDIRDTKTRTLLYNGCLGPGKYGWKYGFVPPAEDVPEVRELVLDALNEIMNEQRRWEAEQKEANVIKDNAIKKELSDDYSTK